MSASGSDRAIAAVMQWAAREEWRGWLEDLKFTGGGPAW